MIITSYGLHQAGGVPFLVQASGATNLISPELQAPFTLQLGHKRARCPHEIDLDVWAETPEWIDDPLVAAFLPLPGRRSVVLYDPGGGHDRLLQQLCRLSSPTRNLMEPAWATWSPAIYSASNLSPLVRMAAEHYHTPAVLQHQGFASVHNRKLIVSARDRLPLFSDFEWVTTSLTEADVAHLPLEAIGAGALRRYMDDA